MTQAQRTLNNRYELQAKVGDGGMAVVYRALDTQLNRVVAIKILRDTYASDPAFLQRFKREAQSAASLSHPNIVSIYDVGQDGDLNLNYIVMEYIEGANLKEKINREAPLPTAEALEIAAQICDALDYAHSRGLIHRDIKPQNILIDRNNRVKVADFGIAKSQGDMTLTQAGVTLGTVHYFSPEQAKGQTALPQSDLYSIGVVIYEMLTGRIPFESDNAVALAIKHIEEPPPPPRRYNPNIPPELEQVILKAMSKNPAQRYASGKVFAQVLRDFEKQADKSTIALPLNPPVAPNQRRNSGPNNVYTEVNVPPSPSRPVRQGTYNNAPPQSPPYAQNPETNYNGDYAAAPRRSSQAYVSQRQTQYNQTEPPPAAGYEERRGPGCGAWILGGAALAVLLGIVLFAVFVLLPQLNNNPAPAPTVTPAPAIPATATLAPIGQTTVPNVVGKKQQDAENDLKAAGLTIGETRQEVKDGVAAGQVISQNPAANAKVNQQTKVSLVVSKGQDLVTLPSFSNTDPNATRQTLEKLGFKVEQAQENSQNIQAGAVIRTDPAGGDGVQIARGSKVTIYVSTGPLPTATPRPTPTQPPPPPTAVPVATPTTPPTRKVLVPGNLIGQDEKFATQVLAQAGLKVSIVRWNETDVRNQFGSDPNQLATALDTYSKLRVGQVLGTDPPSNTTVDDGATVVVAVKR